MDDLRKMATVRIAESMCCNAELAETSIMSIQTRLYATLAVIVGQRFLDLS
jgi:hypothetical protein